MHIVNENLCRKLNSIMSVHVLEGVRGESYQRGYRLKVRERERERERERVCRGERERERDRERESGGKREISINHKMTSLDFDIYCSRKKIFQKITIYTNQTLLEKIFKSQSNTYFKSF